MARIRKILVAYDGSPQSKEALAWAVDLSLLNKAQVCVAKVIEAMSIAEMTALYEAGSGDDLVAYIEEVKATDRRLLEDAIATIGQRKGVAITTALLNGNIAAALINYAKETGMDMIVAGTKGHGALEGLLMGSVTRHLVSLSPIPVLVVKD
ncbi:MAG: universal stress protein [Veillonellaceae bacterium]|nr:universal stress protein [Veillonellaceae bacterium]